MDALLLQQLNEWHEKEEFALIIHNIEQIPEAERDYELISQLARAYNNQSRYHEAVEQLLSIATPGQQDPVWHFRLGYAYCYLARFDQALEAFQQSDQLEPEDEKTKLFLNEVKPWADKMNQDRERYNRELAIWNQQHEHQSLFASLDIDRFFEQSEYAQKEYVSDPFDQKMIQSIEKELGYVLPAAYIALMHIQNGGAPALTVFPTTESTSWAQDHIAITSIMGIGRDKGYSLGGSLGSRFMIEEWGYPDLGIVICDCPSAGHDVVMLDYRFCGPEGEPAVIHVDQEDDYKITYLAPNFEAFICGLVDEEAFELD